MFTCIFEIDDVSTCGEKFPFLIDLREHIAQCHLNLKLFECAGCQEGFMTMDKMISHLAQCDLKTGDIIVKTDVVRNEMTLQSHELLEELVLRCVHDVINSAYSRGLEGAECVEVGYPPSSFSEIDDGRSLFPVCKPQASKTYDSQSNSSDEGSASPHMQAHFPDIEVESSASQGSAHEPLQSQQPLSTNNDTESITYRSLILLEHKDMKDILEWFIQYGLLAPGRFCPTCGKPMKLTVKRDYNDTYAWVCRTEGDKKHNCRISVRKGSLFEGSKLALCKILQMAYLWLHVSERDFLRMELSMTYDTTIRNWLKLFRQVCVTACLRENERIGGTGAIVEIDESKFGKWKFGRGGSVDGKWVFAGIEKGTMNCFFEVVKHRTRETLLEVIKKYVHPGTTIISDCWKTYDCFADARFEQMALSHMMQFKEPEIGTHTNVVGEVWNVLKSEFRKRACRSNTFYFGSYFLEFFWRRKYRNKKEQQFPSFLAAIKEMYHFAPVLGGASEFNGDFSLQKTEA